MKKVTLALAATVALLLPAMVDSPPYVHSNSAHNNIDWD